MGMGQAMPMEPGDMAGMDHDAMGQGAEMPGMSHLNDVTYDAYLANDRTLDDPEVVPVEPRSLVRLRIINGAASTNFWIDLGALDGHLLAVDGSPCRRSKIDDAGKILRGRRFPLAMSQRIDVAVGIPAAGAYPILAQREGDRAQTGIILATPGAAIARVAGTATEPAPPLGLDLDREIAAVYPLGRAADRRHTLDLTGSMMGFVWSLNGRKFGAHEPLRVRQGERVEIEMVNRTDMSHPMHLHGHTFQVVGIDRQPLYGPMRDTVLVPVNGRVTIAFDADNPGRWALHCHNLYHMAAGMMTTVDYEA
jgi:FtsP/CotA-like multicopper oxidase with cupredoxin domain